MPTHNQTPTLTKPWPPLACSRTAGPKTVTVTANRRSRPPRSTSGLATWPPFGFGSKCKRSGASAAWVTEPALTTQPSPPSCATSWSFGPKTGQTCSTACKPWNTLCLKFGLSKESAAHKPDYRGHKPKKPSASFTLPRPAHANTGKHSKAATAVHCQKNALAAAPTPGSAGAATANTKHTATARHKNLKKSMRCTVLQKRKSHGQ